MRSAPSRTSLPQSWMRPFTRNAFAPYRYGSNWLTTGVSAGMNTKHSIPARAAYAAAAPPAFPAVGSATRFTPSHFAMLTAAVMPRLLKLPVGNCDSSLTHRRDSPSCFPSRGQGSSGVIPSPSVTGSTSSGSGRSSRYRHRLGGRAATSAGVTAARTRSRS